MIPGTARKGALSLPFRMEAKPEAQHVQTRAHTRKKI